MIIMPLPVLEIIFYALRLHSKYHSLFLHLQTFPQFYFHFVIMGYLMSSTIRLQHNYTEKVINNLSNNLQRNNVLDLIY